MSLIQLSLLTRVALIHPNSAISFNGTTCRASGSSSVSLLIASCLIKEILGDLSPPWRQKCGQTFYQSLHQDPKQIRSLRQGKTLLWRFHCSSAFQSMNEQCHYPCFTARETPWSCKESMAKQGTEPRSPESPPTRPCLLSLLHNFILYSVFHTDRKPQWFAALNGVSREREKSLRHTDKGDGQCFLQIWNELWSQ